MAGGTSCLSLTCSIIGILFATVSVAGIGLSLFLVFGEPYSQKNVQGTYSPNWEDIGMLHSLLTYIFIDFTFLIICIYYKSLISSKAAKTAVWLEFLEDLTNILKIPKKFGF